MLEMKVNAMTRKVVEIEKANEQLRGRTWYNIMEQVGEDLWEVKIQVQWANGKQVEVMVVNPLATTFEAVNLTREMHELTGWKIVLVEQD